MIESILGLHFLTSQCSRREIWAVRGSSRLRLAPPKATAGTKQNTGGQVLGLFLLIWAISLHAIFLDGILSTASKRPAGFNSLLHKEWTFRSILDAYEVRSSILFKNRDSHRTRKMRTWAVVLCCWGVETGDIVPCCDIEENKLL